MSAEDTAVSIAVLIDRDPVMASQIKTHIAPHRLAELLGITAADLVPPANDPAQAVIQDPEPLAGLVQA